MAQNQDASKPAEEIDKEAIEKALIEGDLSFLTTAQRISYYKNVCESLNLNPLTKPFGYILMKRGKDDDGPKILTLYAKKDCAEQIRKNRKISITKSEGSVQGTLYVHHVVGHDLDGRVDSSTGAVDIGGKFGEYLANAIMRAETKAKRRFTLSIAGLGFLDETEVESIEGIQVIPDEGELKLDLSNMPKAPTPAQRPTAAQAVANLKQTVDQKHTSKDPAPAATPASNLPDEPYCECTHRLGAHGPDGRRMCLDPKCACNGFSEKTATPKEPAAPAPATPQTFDFEAWKAGVLASTTVKGLLSEYHFEKLPSNLQSQENTGFFWKQYHKLKGAKDAKKATAAT